MIILAFKGRLSEFSKKWKEGKKNTIIVSRIILKAATTVIQLIGLNDMQKRREKDNQIRTILPAMRKKRPLKSV